MQNKICENCKSKFDEKEHIPISLNCTHIICFDCHKKLKNNFADNCCPICKKRKNKISFDSTKLLMNTDINNKSKLIKSKSSIIKFKKMNLDRKRRLSHVINFNNKNREKFSSIKINNTLPKMNTLNKKFIEIAPLPLDFLTKKRKTTSNLINNKFNKQNHKPNNSFNTIITLNTNNQNNNNYNTDSSFLESKKSHKIFQSHKKSNLSTFYNQEESSELMSNKNNKSINKSIIKDNYKENNKEGNKYINIKNIKENCSIHIEKEIEFYCDTCQSLACGICLIDYHNGHNFGLLSDIIDKIKINISDADNILNELIYQNNNNHQLLNIILNELNEYKNEQELLVKKSFDEIFNKLNNIKVKIIEEFNNKYNLEYFRFEKFKNIFEEDIYEIKKTKLIINEILKEFDISSEVKILKEKYNYDSFLYWCNINIKRLYINQKKLKNEMIIDPSLKPFPININELISLLNLIEPKNIVYPFLNNNSVIINKNNSENNNNVSTNFYNNISTIKNNKSYTFNNNANYNNKNNYMDIYYRKNNSADIVLQNKMLLKDNNEENNKINDDIINNNENYNYNNNNINKNYYPENFQFHQYSQPDKNNIFTQILSKDNISFLEKQEKSMSSLPLIKNNRINNSFNPVKKEEIDRFYNNMKINNEISIYCFTNLNSCLIYHIPTQNWKYIPYQNELSKKISYQKYTSISLIPDGKMIITGGYNTISKEITNTIYQINIYNINDIKILKPMKRKRYSHSCIYLQNEIYCIGGYGYNNDKTNNSSSKIISLKSCEKYDIKNKEWKNIKDLNSARACFGKCIYNNNIFVFGGYDNKNILSSIEKYEPITDIWITYHIKLPIKIAELGVINLNNKYIFLLGGVDENNNLLDNVYIGRLDHNIINYSWKEGPKLICPRKIRNNCFYLNNYIYVIGGSSEGICEKYSLIKTKWEMIRSYLTVLNEIKEETKMKYLSSELGFNF